MLVVRFGVCFVVVVVMISGNDWFGSVASDSIRHDSKDMFPFSLFGRPGRRLRHAEGALWAIAALSLSLSLSLSPPITFLSSLVRVRSKRQPLIFEVPSSPFNGSFVAMLLTNWKFAISYLSHSLLNVPHSITFL